MNTIDKQRGTIGNGKGCTMKECSSMFLDVVLVVRRSVEKLNGPSAGKSHKGHPCIRKILLQTCILSIPAQLVPFHNTTSLLKNK